MKVNRMSSENSLPTWALNIDESSVVKQSSEDVFLMAEAAKHIPEVLSDDILVSEREKIDKCASCEDTYYYSNKWDNSDVSQLREYASVCGLSIDKFQAVNPDEFVKADIERTASAKIVKIASETVVESDPFADLKLNDPFHLEDMAEEAPREKWEEVKSASKLEDRPSMMTNAVVPIGGGEDYLANSDVPLAKNQNSIVNPDAIGQLASSDKEDTGVRLAREAAEREEAKGARHEAWQEDKIKAMVHNEDLPKGTVFCTEVMDAQPGLNSPSSQMGVYAKFDIDSVPEKTIGETLADRSEERRQEIQGRDKEDHDFGIQSEASRTISDPFVDSLKKSLGK